jgi:putative addiction module killer protein
MEIRRYLSESGRDVLASGWHNCEIFEPGRRSWPGSNRLSAGNFGECKTLRGGLFEMRIDWGPGYRVYYAMVGKACVLLLCGGDKRKQSSDIKRAHEYLKDYRERTQ